MRELTKKQKNALLQGILDEGLPKSRAAALEVLKNRAMTGFVSPDGDLIYGRCLGGDRTVYTVSMNLSTKGGRYCRPTLRCTCPSRQFPCKHEYALLFMYQEGGCLEQAPETWPGVEQRTRRRRRMTENKMKRCAVTEALLRQTLQHFDESIVKAVQGEVKDTLEDLLLLPEERVQDVLLTRVFVMLLLTSKVLLSRLSSTSRRGGRGEKIKGLGAPSAWSESKERQLEDALHAVVWTNAPWDGAKDLLQQAADKRIIRATAYQLGGRKERDRSLLDVDEAERIFPMCEAAVEIFERAAPSFVTAPSIEALVPIGALFAHFMEKSTVGWVSRVSYIQMLLGIGPENQEQWRQMNEPQLQRHLREADSKTLLTS